MKVTEGWLNQYLIMHTHMTHMFSKDTPERLHHEMHARVFELAIEAFLHNKKKGESSEQG